MKQIKLNRDRTVNILDVQKFYILVINNHDLYIIQDNRDNTCEYITFPGNRQEDSDYPCLQRLIEYQLTQTYFTDCKIYQFENEQEFLKSRQAGVI